MYIQCNYINILTLIKVAKVTDTILKYKKVGNYCSTQLYAVPTLSSSLYHHINNDTLSCVCAPV